MSDHKEETLSPDELRKRLYQTFKSRGLLDTLKTQLRKQLIQELQSPSATDPLRTVSAKADSVSLLASNSLIIDHLQTCGYEYTQSIFYSESGVNKHTVFSMRDVLQLLKISPHSPLYKSVVSNVQSGQKGLLINLLSELIDHHTHADLCNAETQTSTTPVDYKQSLVEKLQVIDEEYEALRQRGNRWASVEAKLAEFRKEMEEQARTELKSKLQHFQEVEVSRMRMEEQEKSRKELQELRHRLEKNYELKSEALTSREKNAIERLQKQQEIEEREIYAQRQTLLKEIESVRNREAELNLRMEAFQKNYKLHEEKVRSIDELLRQRELAVKTMEESFDQRLNTELRKHQVELKEDYARRTENLVENERRNKEETLRLQKEATVLSAKMDEYNQTVSELKQTQVELESLRAEGGALTRQNAILLKRLEAVSDYATVKRERVELQAELQLLKERLEEKQLENQRLRQVLSAPSQEQLTLQAEVRRLETARRLEQDEFQNQKEVFHTQLKDEVERCAQLKAQLLECEVRTRWMSTNTEEIKQQLWLTQQALENEVLRNPKPSLVDRSVLNLIPDKVIPPDLKIDSSLPKATTGYDDEDVCNPGPVSRGRQRSVWPRAGSPELGMEPVNEALARIRELEKEADTLEEAYRNYRQRAVRAVTQTPPERTTAIPTYVRPTTTTQQRVTFDLDGPPLGPVFINREPSHRDLSETPVSAERTPLRVRTPAPRRLSSTPVSASKTHPRHLSENDVVVDQSAITFTGLSPDRDVSPILVPVSSTEYTHFTPPSSPQMKSTAKDQNSPLKLQEVISSSSQESSPKPEKISIQDLTEPLTDLHCSLELQDGRIPCPTQPQPGLEEREDSPQNHQRRDGVTSAVTAGEGKEEENDEKEEEGIQEEREEDEEREKKQEDEEKEQEMREVVQEPQAVCEGGGVEGKEYVPSGLMKEEKEEVIEVEEKKVSSEQNPTSTDTLQRYMMMVMQNKERELRQQNSGKDESEDQSQEAATLTDSKDNSVAAFSHDEADDDFW